MSFLTNNDQEDSRKWLSVVVTSITSIVLLFINSLGWLDKPQLAISYILGPIYISSSNLAIEVKDFFTTIAGISSFRDQYNQMKLDIANYETESLNYIFLENENLDLKSQLELANKDNVYLESQVLDHIENDYIIINKGSAENVKEGDIAVLGKSFVGIVIEVGSYTSKVKLPISKSSFLEAYVISSKKEENRRILSRGVVSGSSDGIRIENIGMNSGVDNGDVVIVNDSKVGENLVLGTVVGLSEDPATTTRAGYVSSAVDYYDLINVFVRL